MCGLAGALTDLAFLPGLTTSQLVGMRDAALERGPDAGGQHQEGPLSLAHRRLAVVGLGELGAQPMIGEHWVLAYNGELYDQEELHESLEQVGRGEASARARGSDTALLLACLEAFGPGILRRLRGMFALAAWDRRRQRLLLARDGLGVKPLYVWRSSHELVFASDVRSLLAHPRVPVRPDLVGVSAYLTTLRSTHPGGTLFEGVAMVEPGTWVLAQFESSRLELEVTRFDRSPGVDRAWTERDAAEALGQALERSVQTQLRADVPVCSLLSGGIDSSVVASVARRTHPSLRTYAAGSPMPGGDLEHAQLVASALGTNHEEARIDHDLFRDGWSDLVDRGGLPLSTPNEVAIHAVASRLRADGCIVTLSGEGADELLGGYGEVLEACAAFEQNPPAGLSPGRFHLEASAWVPSAAKADLFLEGLWEGMDGDQALFEGLDRLFEECRNEAGAQAERLDAHLRFQRRLNLVCLLERLDRATMLASVEGRVPFADQAIRDLAESFPASLKYAAASEESGGGAGVATLPRTKRVLRQAVQGWVPQAVLHRPKASFPLPFQQWLAPAAQGLRESPFASALFRPEVLELIAAGPEARWSFAWPVLNIARWGDRWFS